MLPTRISQALAAVTLICVPLGISRADVSAGERLARQWCANCHVISCKSLDLI